VPHLIEVAFRGNRKEFFQWDEETAPALKSAVIVEADRGEDFGRVHSTGELAQVRCRGCAHGCGTTPPPRKALRLATSDEEVRERELTAENETTRRRAMERVKANHLVMKLTDAEWQWDRRKLTLYFTAERRVDFRALVRDLAAMFRTRIELKQIGVRDEAKRLSGVGRCGREYCSSSWLPDLRPVNLGVAKDQKLSLNPQQISGACGRLMCCLRYEHEFYVQSRRRFPKEGKILQTSLGEEKVVSCDIFFDRVTLRTAEGDTRVVALAELREEIGGFGDVHVTDTHEVPSDTEDMAIDVDLEQSGRRARTPTPSRGVPRATPAASTPREDSVLASTSLAAAVSGATPVSAPTSATVSPPVPAPIVAPEVLPTTTSAPSTMHPEAAPRPPGEADATDESSTMDAIVSLPTEDSAESSASETRRKRRRGRRGGRRLRAAEQRRQGEPGSPESESSTTQHDDDGDDDADDREDERPDTAYPV
jgi:cell fate regulator YaaT (PSP1 superfamily)